MGANADKTACQRAFAEGARALTMIISMRPVCEEERIPAIFCDPVGN